jgi:N-acyl-D-aspartate/D-glutamate deacylase
MLALLLLKGPFWMFIVGTLALAPVLQGQTYPNPEAPADALPPAADVIFRNARVLDGHGNPWVLGDVAIRGDRIVAVGRLGDSWRSAREIDVRGYYLAPGFIDVHSHASEGLVDSERSAALPMVYQGVTTVFVNPDGGGPTDLDAQRAALLTDGLGVNVALLIGHGSLRGDVMGMEDRPATPEELGAMVDGVRRAMAAGAFGVSTGPFYAPGSFAATSELIALAREAASWGGIYTSHIRDESDYSIGLVAAVDEVIEIAREAEIRVIVTHIKALGPRVWGYANAVVRRIERAREQGLEVFADQYPYTASATGLSAALIPRWAQEGGTAAMHARFKDPEMRSRILAEVAENLDRRGGADRIQFRQHTADPSIEGQTLDAVARARGLDPMEATLALLMEGSPGIVSFNMDDDDIALFMRQPWTMASSDGEFPLWKQGVPHPRAYGSFARRLGHYTRDLGVLTLEEAVRGMTSLPALVHRMENRGSVRVGGVADLVVFDLNSIHDPATFTEPHQYAQGIRHVLVNGVFVLEDGEPTLARPGRVLRMGQDDGMDQDVGAEIPRS